MHNVIPFLPVVGALLGLVGLAAPFHSSRRRRLGDNLPTSARDRAGEIRRAPRRAETSGAPGR